MLKDTLHKIVFEDIENITSQNLPWNKFHNKTVFISGANGFLPSYLVYTLLLLNDKLNFNIKVIALVRNKQKAENRFKNELLRNDFQLLIQDVCEPINLVDKIDFIIHAASQASPKYYSIDPIGTLNPNVIGTNNLLKLALKNNVETFLFFSSSEVYGTVDESKIPTCETDFGYINPVTVRSCYAESKRLGETMCISWMHQFGVTTKIVRPFHTYGPGMDLNDGRVYADFISDIVNNRDIVMKSNGLAMRAFCYLADATIGFFTVLLLGKAGEAYNVGNQDGEISIINLAEKLTEMFPEKELNVKKIETNNSEYLKSAVIRNCPDTKKINALGWYANTTIEDGFKKTISSYQ